MIWEHVEEWQFHTGEVILHPFVTVMEVRDGKIVRWHDYSHLGNIIDNAPAVVARTSRPGLRRRRPRGGLVTLAVVDVPDRRATSSATATRSWASPSTTSAPTACWSSRTR